MVDKADKIEIGSKVRLLKDLEMGSLIYKKGHEFTVYDSSHRGFDLVDKHGNKVDECLFIEDQLELVKEDERLSHKVYCPKCRCENLQVIIIRGFTALINCGRCNTKVVQMELSKYEFSNEPKKSSK